jgi:hypothetical protein
MEIGARPIEVHWQGPMRATRASLQIVAHDASEEIDLQLA